MLARLTALATDIMGLYSPYQWPLLLAIACCAYLVYTRRASRLPLPPGPPRIPFLGNVIQMPKEREWITFAEWGRKYGMSSALHQLRDAHVNNEICRQRCLRLAPWPLLHCLELARGHQ